MTISVLSSGLGVFIGKRIDEKFGFITIIGVDVAIISTSSYMFLMSFTGLWFMIFVIGIAMFLTCGYLIRWPRF